MTTIGLIWCVLGLLMASSATLALALSLRQPLSPEPPWSWLPVLAPVQILFGLTGLVAAVFFLRRAAWARRVLEVLTVAAILAVVAVNASVASIWTEQMAASGGEELGPMRYFGILIGVISTLIYGGALGLLIYRLRGADVREAMR